MQTTLILAADNTRARLFAAQGRQTQLTEIADLIHPEGRLSNSGQDSDKPGRSYDSRGGARHAMEPPTSRKQKESGMFAGRIAEMVKENSNRFDDLIIICAPRFLGELRKHLDPALQERIRKEIRKSIAHDEARHIREVAFGETAE